MKKGRIIICEHCGEGIARCDLDSSSGYALHKACRDKRNVERLHAEDEKWRKADRGMWRKEDSGGL